MSILLVTENFPPKVGGSGKYLWEIYRRLPPGQVVVAAGEHPGQADFDRSHDLRVVRMPLTLESWGLCSSRALRQYGRAARGLCRVVKAEHVGRVHCGRCLPEGLLGLWLKCWAGIPYACYCYGEEMNYACSSRELSWLMRRVLGAAEFLTAISRNTVRILTDEWGIPAERIRLLYPGVDTGQFVPASRSPTVRAQLGWGDRPVVLTVSRLQKRKGHDHLIRALSAVRKSVPDVLYAVVGDGEERQYLEGLVTQERAGGHVQFLGQLDDAGIVRCYQQCDLFVLPNRQVGQDIEGFGMVLLEAQACGKPVVAGTSGGTAETMRIPESGYVVSCDGPDELGALLAELLSDRAQLARMGEMGRQWVVKQFDWTVLGAQARQLFLGQPLAPAAASQAV